MFLAACAGIFLFGIVLALLGTLFGLPEVRARLRVNLGQQGDLFLILYFGVFLSSLVAGPLIDRMGNKLVLMVSALLVTARLRPLWRRSRADAQCAGNVLRHRSAWDSAAHGQPFDPVADPRVATVRRGAGRTHYYRLLCAALSAPRANPRVLRCAICCR